MILIILFLIQIFLLFMVSIKYGLGLAVLISLIVGVNHIFYKELDDWRLK
jgi:hypothetical protein